MSALLDDLNKTIKSLTDRIATLEGQNLNQKLEILNEKAENTNKTISDLIKTAEDNQALKDLFNELSRRIKDIEDQYSELAIQFIRYTKKHPTPANIPTDIQQRLADIESIHSIQTKLKTIQAKRESIPS